MKLYHIGIIGFALLISCGENKEAKEEKSNKEKDTTAQVVDSSTVEKDQKDETFYFENYAQYDTKSKLTEAFDAKNLEDGSSWYAEGTVEKKHTILTDPKNGNIIKFLWEDDGKTLGSLETHYILYDKDFNVQGAQKIKSKCGIYTGMSLKELDTWNQDTVIFSGFGWDYAGNIFNRGGGELTKCKTQIRLALDDHKGYEYEATTKYLGDKELHSKMVGILEAPIVIDEMTYYLKN